MRAVVDFRVEPSLPAELDPLRELAFNLWWSWNPDGVDLFRRVDESLWEATRHNPVLMLNFLDQRKLGRLAGDHVRDGPRAVGVRGAVRAPGCAG